MNTHTHDGPEQILQRGNEAEILAALPRYLAGYEVPRGIQDEPSHLSLMRLVRQIGEVHRQPIAAATLALLRSAVQNIRDFDQAIFQPLVSFCAELQDDSITREMAAFASTFSAHHPLPKAARRIVLGVLVDAKPPQSEDFWMAIYDADPTAHAGMAASGLLSLDAFDKAVSMYPKVIKNAMSGSIVTLLVDMKWNKLQGEGRRRLVEALEKTVGNCDPRYVETLNSWLKDKRATV